MEDSKLTARELRSRYRYEERNFEGKDLSGESLRGMNLEEVNLSNADLSRTDIRGTNFTGATLTGTKFEGAKAGATRLWRLLHLLIAFTLLGFTSFLVGMSWAFLVETLLSKNFIETLLAKILTGVLGIILPFLILGLIYAKGLLAAFGIAIISIGFSIGVSTSILGIGAVVSSSDLGDIFAVGFILALVTGVTFISASVGVVGIAISIATNDKVKVSIAAIFMVTAIFSLLGVYFHSDGHLSISLPEIVSLLGIILNVVVGFLVSKRALSGDPRDHLVRGISVWLSSLGGTRFVGANLTNANFTSAVLRGANFYQSTILKTRFHLARRLNLARLGGTILSSIQVQSLLVSLRGSDQCFKGLNMEGANLDGAYLADSNLVGVNLSQATLEGATLVRANLTNLDLKGSNLTGANLSHANLAEADLSQANLEGANLIQANLAKTQALGTIFYQTTLTGVILESWNIDSTTQLNGAVCDYVYLLRDKRERRPNSGVFEPGEFSKFFQEVLDTIDLVFRHGVDWQAFIETFSQIQVQYEDSEVSVQSIENKGDGVVVVRLNALSDTDKASIHKSFYENYQRAFERVEEYYKKILNAKEDEIIRYRDQNTDMLSIIKGFAKRPINQFDNRQYNSYGDKANVAIQYGDESTIDLQAQEISDSGE